MGHRLEIYTTNDHAQELIDISKSYNVDAKVIGRVEDADKTEVIIKDEKGVYNYGM